MQYDIAVFIGRFQPFHLGQQAVVRRALTLADKVLIMIGSAFQPRTTRNPWSYEERAEMIRAVFTPEENARIICQPLLDIRYNNAVWITQVQKAVYDLCSDEKTSVTLIGHAARGSGYYTAQFPQWDAVTVDNMEDVSGSKVRRNLLTGGDPAELDKLVDARLKPRLEAFAASPEGENLKDEYAFIKTYQKGWENAPFPPTHVTVDTVVVQSGHILLVKRDARPGRGLWALPGGFINPDERLLDIAIAKLKEKTKIKVPAPVLYGSVKQQAVFDDPYCSERGRTITHTFHIELRPEEELPKVKGGAGTEKCAWIPLGQLDPSWMFDDHYFIIQKMLGTR